ncbi:MAG: hypothetical protein FWG66_11080 [Spirochaetes bacterium]|nr:hypothetical protein [Spirochaetota bacterium]
MAFGLGRNSPVVLSLGRDNYEAMLERHAQNVRWRTAHKCACALETNRSADPRCKKCGGSGETYGYQKETVQTLRLAVFQGLAELPPEHEGGEITGAFDTGGDALKVSQMGRYAKLEHPAREMRSGESADVTVRLQTASIIEEAALQPLGNGFYRVPEALANKSPIEGVLLREPADLVGIDSVTDGGGQEVEVLEFRLDTVRLKDGGARQPLTARGVRFVKPHKFLILSQNLEKQDAAIVNAHGGDALASFPYKYKVAEGDIITVLAGANVRKAVIKRRGEGFDDVLPDFFVGGILLVSGREKEYAEGRDYALAGTNRLRWLGESRPAEGENLSVAYEYLPTYRVLKSVPQLRSSENQRMPRKAVLKLFSAVQESRGANRQKGEAW